MLPQYQPRLSWQLIDYQYATSLIQSKQAAQEEIFEAMLKYNMVNSIEVTMSPSQTTYKVEFDNSPNKPSELNSEYEA